ncbi:MAG: phenylacetic acid degradation protein PaaN [Herbaspirillum sp.]
MSHPFFERHQQLLAQAVRAIANRGYWSAYTEMPSPKAYGESADSDGKAAFEAYLGHPFRLAQVETGAQTGHEVSPYGPSLEVRYPRVDLDLMFSSIKQAIPGWRKAGPKVWVGVSLEILHRLNQRSFELAYSVMHTTGQAFMMAFQAGGPHAQDRGLEAVAYAWREMSGVPLSAYWEKPQGRGEPLKMSKSFHIVPRGVSLVIGCCTFPTWNSYPGLFASLATGNAVIVKPHPGAILPLAITVQVAQDVLQEAGFDPNLVSLAAHDQGDELAAQLAVRPEVGLIDFTGSSANGNWIERNAFQAQVYTEKSGINQIIVDSTDDAKGMARNIAFSLALYSGQMCTAPQNIYIPKEGIDTSDGRLSFDEVTQLIAGAVSKLVADPVKAVEITGAIQNTAILQRIDVARQCGEIVLDSVALTHPAFPDACVRTPLMLKVPATDQAAAMQEFFGPISFFIPVEDTASAIALAELTVREKGALTLSLYSTERSVIEKTRDAAETAGVALSINLTQGVFVNQSAAFSDFHGTGANPAANASLSDSAFVANRFRVVQSREHV